MPMEFGVSWPSQKTLAEQTALGERTVRRVLAAMDARGVIRRILRRRDNGSRQSDMILLAAFDGRKPAPPGMLELGSDQEPNGPNFAPSEQPAIRDNRAIWPPDNRPSDPDPPATVAALDTSKILKSLATAHAREDADPCEVLPDTADPLQACLAVAGPGFDPDAQLDHDAAFEVARWIERGFDLDRDVLPVIAAKTRDSRASPIRTFDYFTPAIAERHARRVAFEAGGRNAGEPGSGRTGSAAADLQRRASTGQANASAQSQSVGQVAHPAAPIAPTDTATMIAGWIADGRYVPPSAISTTMRQELLARGLVKEEALRALQIY